MNYYAIYYPRGFYNEADVVAFKDKKSRDEFCCRVHGARQITRKEARRMIGRDYCGDDENYIRGINVFRAETNDYPYAVSVCMDNMLKFRFREYAKNDECEYPYPEMPDGLSSPVAI